MSLPSHFQIPPDQSLTASITRISRFCYNAVHKASRYISGLVWMPAVLPPSPSPINVPTPDQSGSVSGTSPPMESEKSNSDSHSARDSNVELDSENWAYGPDTNQDSSSKAIEKSDNPEPVSPTQIEFELFLQLSLSMDPEDSTPDVDPSTRDSTFKPISTKFSNVTDTGRDAYIKEPGSCPKPVPHFRPANLDLNQPPFRFTFNVLTVTPANVPTTQPAMNSDDSDSDFDPSASDGTSELYSDNLSYESNASRDSFIPEPRSFSTPVRRWRPVFGNIDLNLPLFRFTFKPPTTEPSTSILDSPQASSPQPTSPWGYKMKDMALQYKKTIDC